MAKDSRFKNHKKYRWIALFAKLASVAIFTYVFGRLTMKVTIPGLETQTLGTLLTTIGSLVIYYGIIFILNRYRNFRSNTDLGKSIAVYTLVVLILMSLESAYSGVLQNMIYRIAFGPSGIIDVQEAISITNVTHQGLYLLLGFGVHLAFSFVTGIIIYILYKKVLDRQEVLDQI